MRKQTHSRNLQPLLRALALARITTLILDNYEMEEYIKAERETLRELETGRSKRIGIY